LKKRAEDLGFPSQFKVKLCLRTVYRLKLSLVLGLLEMLRCPRWKTVG